MKGDEGVKTGEEGADSALFFFRSRDGNRGVPEFAAANRGESRSGGNNRPVAILFLLYKILIEELITRYTSDASTENHIKSGFSYSTNRCSNAHDQIASICSFGNLSCPDPWTNPSIF